MKRNRRPRAGLRCAGALLPSVAARRNAGRALREGQGREVAGVLYRRPGRAAREARQAVHAAVSRHRGHGDRRLQQRAERADREADGRQASSRSTWRSSRPCRTSSTGRSRASCSRSSRTASTRSCRTCAIRTAPTWRSPPTRSTYAYNTAAVTRRGRAEVGAGFPQARCFQGKLISVYPARRRRRALSVPSDRAEIRLGAGWTATWPTSRISSRAISRWRAASPTAR